MLGFKKKEERIIEPKDKPDFLGDTQALGKVGREILPVMHDTLYDLQQEAAENSTLPISESISHRHSDTDDKAEYDDIADQALAKEDKRFKEIQHKRYRVTEGRPGRRGNEHHNNFKGGARIADVLTGDDDVAARYENEREQEILDDINKMAA
jgi:hypothetical protein